jgi:electron transfer flavoprotein beta subunit
VKIVVCCKAVPGPVTDVAAEGAAIRYRSQFQTMNECDEYAMEEAIVLKRLFGGEIIALTMGALTTQEILYMAAAKGADRIVRVDAQAQDPSAASVILAAALKTLAPDLILTGTQSRDSLSSFVGVAIAQRLDIPFAFAVTAIDKDGDGAIKVRKELGGGRYADVRLPLPALVCIQTGIQPLNYVPPARMMRARQQAPKSLSLADLGLTPESVAPKGYRIDAVFPPQRTGQATMLEGPPPEAVRALLAKMKEVRG